MERDDDLSEMGPAAREDIAQARDRWEEAVSALRDRFGVDRLVGMTVSQARDAVESAGGEFHTDDAPTPAKLDANRVIVSVDAGRVASTSIG